MTRITVDLIRKRAEHNECCVGSLEEVALHQQNIEKIEVFGQACRYLKILYLQHNLIAKIQNLHRLKNLEYVNLALNNITKIQNLQRCESLKKLDLTVNFIDKPGLLSVPSLQHNIHLEELMLTGNPCTDWDGYRNYVIAKLPQLKSLDGKQIKKRERIEAGQQMDQGLEQRLIQELFKEGFDPESAACVEDDSLEYDENMEILETGYVDEKGELRRPWCAQTRLLEYRESEQQKKEAEEKDRNAKKLPDPFDSSKLQPARREDFPELKPDEEIKQKNEGEWEFSLDQNSEGDAIVLEVHISKFLDTVLIKADVQPKFVRLLIKGRLLQLILPLEVKPDQSIAQRSKASGNLVVIMPKENPDEELVDVAHIRPAYKENNQKQEQVNPQVEKNLDRKPQLKPEKNKLIKVANYVALVTCNSDDEDAVPPIES